MSNSRLVTLRTAFARLNVGSELMQDTRLPDDEGAETRLPFARLRWAIHDKGKFTTLIADLSYFVSSLRALFRVPRYDMS